MMQMKIKDDYEVPLMATSSANAAASQYMGHGQDQQLAQGHYLQKHIWQNTNIIRGGPAPPIFGTTLTRASLTNAEIKVCVSYF